MRYPQKVTNARRKSEGTVPEKGTQHNQGEGKDAAHKRREREEQKRGGDQKRGEKDRIGVNKKGKGKIKRQT